MIDHHSSGYKTDWAMLKAKYKDRACLYRLRKTHPPAAFWTRVSIAWTYPESENNGFPSTALCAQMDQFEQGFDEIIEKKGLSWLVLVITGMGLKEWTFYVTEFKDFIREFNDVMLGRPIAPVKITHYQDPDCQYWAEVRKHLP